METSENTSCDDSSDCYSEYLSEYSDHNSDDDEEDFSDDDDISEDFDETCFELEHIQKYLTDMLKNLDNYLSSDQSSDSDGEVSNETGDHASKYDGCSDRNFLTQQDCGDNSIIPMHTKHTVYSRMKKLNTKTKSLVGMINDFVRSELFIYDCVDDTESEETIAENRESQFYL